LAAESQVGPQGPRVLGPEKVFGDGYEAPGGVKGHHPQLRDEAADEAAGGHVEGRIPCRHADRGDALAEDAVGLG